MNKKSLLLLSLTAILAACNKGTGNNDIFTKARKIKVPNETKQGVYDRYNTASMITYCKTETHQATREKGGEWEEAPVGGLLESYYHTFCYHTEGNNGCYLQEIYNYDTEAETSEIQFEIETIEGKLQYTEGEGGWYEESAKKCYQLVFDSFHSWNTSYFCGATELLASIARTAYMPQQVLNKFANKFELVEEGPGSFYINKNEECLYRTTQVDYFIEEYMVIYEDYLLKGYRNRFGLTVTEKEGTTEYKNTLIYTFQLVDVKYIFIS